MTIPPTTKPLGPRVFAVLLICVETTHFLFTRGLIVFDADVLDYVHYYPAEFIGFVLRYLPDMLAFALAIVLWFWRYATWPKLTAFLLVVGQTIVHFTVTATLSTWIAWFFLFYSVFLVIPHRNKHARATTTIRLKPQGKDALAFLLLVPLVIPVIAPFLAGEPETRPDRVLFRGGASLAERRAMYLNGMKEETSLNAQVIRAFLNESVDEDKILGNLGRLLKDGGDFIMNLMLRILYLDDTSHSLANETRNEIRDTLQLAQYWFTQRDGPSISSGIFWTENHQIAYHAAELLAGQRWKTDTFEGTTMTGAAHAAHAEHMAYQWMTWKGRFGFSEWQSNTYLQINMMALLNIADFAENATLATMATMLLDTICFEFACNWFGDTYATTHGRCYGNTKVAPAGTQPAREDIADVAWMALGLGGYDPDESPSRVGACFATSTYAPPPIMEHVAGDARGGIEHKGSNGFQLDAGATLGIPYDEEHLMFWWGAASPVSEWTIDISMSTIEKYGLDPGIVCGTGVPELLRLGSAIRGTNMSTYAGLIEEITRGVTMETADIYTYRTPHFQLSGSQDHQKGLSGIQEHVWQATLGGNAWVFTSAPGGVNFKGGSFVGGWHPRATFYRNVGIIQYDHVQETVDGEIVGGLLDVAINLLTGNRPYTHAYFPRHAFDGIRQSGSWTFGEKDDGYIALYSLNPTYWANEYELSALGATNCFIVELGSIDEHASFDAFVAAVSTARVSIGRDIIGFNVDYASPSQGNVRVAWDGPMTVGGTAVDIGPYDRWDNAYSQTARGSPVTVIQFGNETLTLDFAAANRTYTAG